MGCGASSKTKKSEYVVKESGGSTQSGAAAGSAGGAAAATPDAKQAPQPSSTESAATTEATKEADSGGEKADRDGDNVSEEDEEDDVMNDEEFEKQLAKNQKKGARAGISAERTEVDENWVPPIHEKTPEQETRLRAALGKCFMFAVLEEEQLATVVKAFEEIPKSKGDTVIKQGAQVTASEPALFVIESGQLSVYKEGIDKAVFVYTNPGQYFGDLALLYNAPRAATVVADDDVKLWSIDRVTFNNLVKDAAQQQIKKRMGFLLEVPLLTGLTDDERANLCDALQVRFVKADEYIIREGELGFEFFIVESGKCQARKGGNPVMDYKDSDFFGELALVKDAPRAADVVAVENCRLLVLGVEVFKRLLGPLEDILKERSQAYEGVNNPAEN